MTDGTDQKPAGSRSWRRLSQRLLARNRQRLDVAGGLLARQLDFWNRKLAERSVPRARQERVEALARGRRTGSGARLSLVSPSSHGDDDSES